MSVLNLSDQSFSIGRFVILLPAAARRLLLVAALLTGCRDSAPPTAITPEPSAEGPAPVVTLSIGFAEAPLEGIVRLHLPAGSRRWAYVVDLDADGEADHEGRLEADLEIPYRFEVPGVHPVRVMLEGPDGTVELERLAVVSDPARFAVQATGQAPALSSRVSFEGVAVSRDGQDVYVGDFGTGAIFRLDRADFSARDTVLLDYGVEALSLSPSGDFLFAGSKYSIPAYRFSLPGLEPRSPPLPSNWGLHKYYAYALDDRRVLYSGDEPVVWDLEVGVQLFRATDPGGFPLYARHFDVTDDGTRAVFVDRGADRPRLAVYSLPALTPLSGIVFPEDRAFKTVAFDAPARRVFAIVNDVADGRITGARFLTIDLESRATVHDLVLGGMEHCNAYCAANPTARSRDGRYVAFEWGDGVLIVESALGIPVARVPGPSSVAADPAVPAGFFLLDRYGSVRRITVGP